MSVTLESAFNTTLTQSLKASGSDTTISLAAVPLTVTSGVMKIGSGTNAEWVYFGGVSSLTITSVNRGLDKDATANNDVTSTNKKDHAIGAPVRLVAHSLTLNRKANLDTDNAHTAGKTTHTSTTESQFQVQSLTTAERDALTGVANGDLVYNETTGAFNGRETGSWSAFGAGAATPNASTTVAGKSELATASEFELGTATGGTGSELVVTPTQARNGLDLEAGENLADEDLVSVESDGKAWKTLRSADNVADTSDTQPYNIVKVVYLTDDLCVNVGRRTNNNLFATAISFSRKTPTQGTRVNFDQTTSADFSVVATGTDSFVVSYIDSVDANKLYATAFTVSGTTIIAGTATKLYDASAANAGVDSCKLDTDKFLVSFNQTTTADPYVVACTVSGTTITAGTAATMEATTMAGSMTRCEQITTDVAGVLWDDGTNLSYGVASVSGTTITANTLVDLYADTIDYSDKLLLMEDGYTMLFFKNFTSGIIKVSQIVNSDANDWDNSGYNAAGDFQIQVDTQTIESLQASEVFDMGNNNIGVISNSTSSAGTDRIRFNVYKWRGNTLDLQFSTTLTTDITTATMVSGCKLTDNGNKAFLIVRDGGDSNQMKYSIYWDTTPQFLGSCVAATTAGNDAPIITSRSVSDTGLVAGTVYYAGNAGAAATHDGTNGQTKIGVATTTTNLYLN